MRGLCESVCLCVSVCVCLCVSVCVCVRGATVSSRGFRMTHRHSQAWLSIPPLMKMTLQTQMSACAHRVVHAECALRTDVSQMHKKPENERRGSS